MKIWAITGYFNPRRFASRYRNFSIFRQNLGLPLLTVEWATDGAFELRPADSDVLVQVAGGNLMWQKERLLNIGLGRLPSSCEIVVWLDCDILFEDESWVEEMQASLAAAPIAQLFSEVTHRGPGGEALLSRRSLAAAWRDPEYLGLAERIRSGESPPARGKRAGSAGEFQERLRLASRPSSGHAWAARRGVLERHGLYDGCVCGTGDMAIALAALGLQQLFWESFPLNARQRAHYETWATPFAAATGGEVGVLGGRIQHLFHGALSNRQYRTRLQWAAQSGFDPAADIVRDLQGPWKWASDAAARDAWMSRYFEARAEDEGFDDHGSWRATPSR